MRLSKTLQGLIERAERKGTAVKRVRSGQVMGGGSYYGDKGDLIEQWRVTIRKPADGFRHILVEHYGTVIADIVQDEVRDYAHLCEYYGESVSDRDALNGLCEYYGIDRGFRYRPSTDEFMEVV